MTSPVETTTARKARKSQNGCITCRIRRVKCDETRPACTRCTSSRRRCDGYLPPTVTLTRRRLADLVRQTPCLGPASESLAPVLRQSPEPLAKGLDALLFNIFRHATAPATASLLPSPFWTHDLLQMAHGESAIWHATLSLGALHRRWESKSGHRTSEEPPVDDNFKQEAVSHYFRAISLAKSITDAPTLRALSVVLVAVSNILGRWSDSRTHLFGGLRLLDREHDNGADIDSTAEVLERLDLQAMTFSDLQAPYPFHSPVQLRSVRRRLQDAEAISSYSQAATLLFALLRQFILVSIREAGGEVSAISSDSDRDAFLADLRMWEAKMHLFEDELKKDYIPALSLRLYHAQLRLWMAAALASDEETRWDTEECLFYFEYIITLAEALLHELSAQSVNPLSLEPAVIVPLFATAHRCRHPHLRRKALKLLKDCRRQEGMWSGVGAAAVANWIIVAEEGMSGLESDRQESIPGTPNNCHIADIPWNLWSYSPSMVATDASWEGIDVIPEFRRVKDIFVKVDYGKQKVEITLQFEGRFSKDTIYF